MKTSSLISAKGVRDNLMAQANVVKLDGFNETLKWTFGLINHQGKYLTAEKFQCRISCGATSLRLKQVWTLEPRENGKVVFKSYLNNYLGADKNGKVFGDTEFNDLTPDNEFDIITQDDGKIGIRSTHLRYLNGTDDKMDCYVLDTKDHKETLWTIQLAMHPQINLRNVNRRTYAHYNVDDGKASICVKEEIPWGKEAMLILEFHNGKYAIRTYNELYLVKDGSLNAVLTDDALYILVFREGTVAFKNNSQTFLTAVGIRAMMQSRNAQVTKDELFVLEDSHPQCKFTNNESGKYCSIRGKQIDVQAKQDEALNEEIWQLEAVDRTDMSGNVKWCIRGNNKNYWQIKDGSTNIVCDGTDLKSPNAQFSLCWLKTAIAFQANNGNYVSMKPNGRLAAISSDCSANGSKFTLDFINRPILILRCEYGFVGTKPATNHLECSRSAYEIFEVVSDKGVYYIKGSSGYWNTQADKTIINNGANPEEFTFELCAHTRMCIMNKDGFYIVGEHNGSFTASGEKGKVSMSYLWEY